MNSFFWAVAGFCSAMFLAAISLFSTLVDDHASDTVRGLLGVLFIGGVMMVGLSAIGWGLSK